MYQKLWLSLCEKMGWKIGQKPLFLRFWDEEAFPKIFRKYIFSSAKDTPSCAKIFQKYFFFAENKVLKVEILFFAFASSSNSFIMTFTFLVSGIVGLAENV